MGSSLLVNWTPTKAALRAERSRSVAVVGRGDWIRTSDILLPKQALYRAELHPDGGLILPHHAPRQRLAPALV